MIGVQLIDNTHADIITIQEIKLTLKAKPSKDNITLTTTYIPSTINTYNTELQMLNVHINYTKHITIANLYIPPRDNTFTQYKTFHTDIQCCIQYITNTPHSVLTVDLNVHYTLWHLYHREQLIADVISNSDHINTKHKHTNQSAKHHTTINIFTRYHHDV